MKKKFKITESQAQMMLNESDPCTSWLAAGPPAQQKTPCCELLAQDPNNIPKWCDASWTPGGGQGSDGWKQCCKDTNTNTNSGNGDKKRYHCEGGTCHAHPSGQYTTLQDCVDNQMTVTGPDANGQFPHGPYGTRYCGDPRGNGDRPCTDVECKNPNHVQGPPPKCECECKDGVGEKGCIKKPYVHWNKDECCCEDKKGICDPSGQHTPGNPVKVDFVGPIYTENKTELSEELKRIKQLLK
tara:strand:+ start:2372 stop:3094 length:723 start_codon:yes stop_codon:yes gene_type:complete